MFQWTSDHSFFLLLSFLFFYDDLFWLGINYAASERAFFSSDNSGGNISIISGFKLNSSISIGYSIASQQGGWASSAQGPSHEIYIKFSPSKKTSQSDGENSTEVSESKK